MPASDDARRLNDFASLIGADGIASEADEHWAMNHHRLTPLWPGKAQKLLEPEAFRRVMRFMLSRTRNGPKAPDAAFPAFVSAYRELLPVIDDPGRNDLRRLPALVLFGFDGQGELPGGPTQTADLYEAHRRPIMHAASFASLPGQRARAAGFQVFAPLAPRIAAAFAHLGYNHDRRYADAPDAESYYDHTNLVFWGLMLVGLMTPLRAEILAGMLQRRLDLPRSAEQLDILAATAAAAQVAAPSDDPAFKALVGKLSALR